MAMGVESAGGSQLHTHSTSEADDFSASVWDILSLRGGFVFLLI